MEPQGLAYLQSTTVVACRCGDVFRVSGSSAYVSRQMKAWQAEHKDCVEPVREARKVFWLSFCDAKKPKGQQFLGACIVDVTAAEADEAALDVLLRFPLAQPGAEWIAAASRKAHQLGCNPGGEVASRELPIDHPNLARYQLGVLMDRATIERIDQELEKP